MNTTTQKSDTDLKNDVLAELRFEPSVNVTDIGVLVKDGTVTLNGFASTYEEKWGAVRAAKRVSGVNGLADDIEVRLWDSFKRSDGDIASAAANQIKWFTALPNGTTRVTVSDGWITLEGEVEWYFQKTRAQDAIQFLAGVKGVNNLITIKPRLPAGNAAAEIESAYGRNALLCAETITVEVSGKKVTLSGEVSSYAKREEAERIAWAAPGVWSVDNGIVVKWSWDLRG
jgi:osmotically-inducible protein OsmY